MPWRDLPASFGPWQTVWKRHRRFCADGTWDRIHGRLLAEADARRGDRLDGVGGLHDQPCPPARDDSRVEPAGPQGACRITRICGLEPPDHALGRSRGGLTTKIHQPSTAGRPLVMPSVAGQAGDSPMFTPAGRPRGPPARPGPARTRPDGCCGDKAYSSRGNRHCSAARGSRPSSPNPTTRSATANGAAPRRPTRQLRRRDLQGPQRRRALLQRPQAVARPGHPLRQARHSPTEAASSSAQSSSGYANKETRPSWCHGLGVGGTARPATDQGRLDR